jgi:hypothetical protein
MAARRRGGRRQREREVARVVGQLARGGIADQGIAFALRTVGVACAAARLAGEPPFAAACRDLAVGARSRDERAAWIILAAARPDAVRRRLAAVGVDVPARRRRRARPAREPALLAGGVASFGESDARPPHCEQLAAIARLLEERRAA